MPLKVIPSNKTFSNIQISQFSSNSKFVNSVGKYALIPLDNSSFCLSKVFTSSETHPSYVELDKSVIYATEYLPNNFPKVSSGTTVEDVDDSAIQILPSPMNTQSVTVTVIFETVFDVSRAKNSLNLLSSILKDLLRLFVFIKGSVIYLENLPSESRNGIHALVIHSIICDTNNNLGFISSKTCVIIKEVISRKYFEQLFKFSQLPRRTFPKDVYRLLKSIIDLKSKTEDNNLLILPPQKVIITGPSGCGKSTFVTSVAAETGAMLISYSDFSKLNGNHAENLKSLFLEAKALAEERSESVCLLLLEQLDLICKRRDGGRSISADNITTTLQLLNLMEKAKNDPKLLIIGTTSKIQNVDPALRTSSTFNFEIMIEQSEEDREDILSSSLQPLNCVEYLTLAKEVAHLTPGYVAADLALVCHKVACINDDRPLNGPEEWRRELKNAVIETKPTSTGGSLGVLKKRLTNTTSLGGLFEVKRKLRATLEEPLNNPQAYLRLGLPLPKGLLLYGPPGCAKTSLVNAVASTIAVTFLSVSSADLYSPFVGEAEQNIVDLFGRARCSAPAILFIDELDALVGRREGREVGVHDRVLSAFLMEMDGVSVPTVACENKLIAENETLSSQTQAWSGSQAQPKSSTVVVIGATNRPDILDAALLRPGRFDKLVYVPAPDVSERLDIMRQVTASMPLNADVDLNRLAELTELFSGADLTHLCTSAALNALAMDGISVTDVRMSHFECTLKSMKPSLTVQQIEWYEKFAQGC